MKGGKSFKGLTVGRSKGAIRKEKKYSRRLMIGKRRKMGKISVSLAKTVSWQKKKEISCFKIITESHVFN